MTTAESPLISAREATEVFEWRRAQLQRCGFGPTAADLLAASRDVDLHRATDLLVRGCPVGLALEILL